MNAKVYFEILCEVALGLEAGRVGALQTFQAPRTRLVQLGLRVAATVD